MSDVRLRGIQRFILERNQRQNHGMFIQLHSIDHVVSQQTDRAIILLGVRLAEDLNVERGDADFTV